MVNFYSLFLTCQEKATVEDAVGECAATRSAQLFLPIRSLLSIFIALTLSLGNCLTWINLARAHK
jgi:hypothetical protein